MTARTQVVAAHSAEVQMLLASVINWQPRHGMFSGSFSGLFGAQDSTPSSTMSFGSNLLGLLSDAKNSG